MKLLYIVLCCCILQCLFLGCFSIQYYGSRRIYTKNGSQPMCTDYIEVEFEFDTERSDVNITIYSSTKSSWFSVGFPDTSLYYDTSINVLQGYAIIYDANETISEYNITSSNNIINSFNKQITQNINILSIDNSGSDITIELNRNLNTGDTNDFIFDLDSYLDCYPILMTVGIGEASQLIFTNTNSWGSSYVYIYNTSFLDDNSTYTQKWSDFIQTPSVFSTEESIFNVSFDMDPNTDIVHVTVINQAIKVPWSYSARGFSLSFPDIADYAYYTTRPDGHYSDYIVMWGDSNNLSPICSQSEETVEEAMFPNIDSSQCFGFLDYSPPRTEWENCIQFLPNPKVQNLIQSQVNQIYTYEYDLEFKSCGYEFNPYEYQTCRPFTITSLAISDVGRNCYEFTDVPPTGGFPDGHSYGMIQIDDFKTRAPTFSPSVSPSSSPSQPPTNSPSYSPTDSPVNPTYAPTEPTNSPTLAPSATPTAKPTNLPTVNRTILDYPDCPGLTVKHLDVLFPADQSMKEFNQLYDNSTNNDASIYKQRRVWSNGVLTIHWTDRFEDGGDWIITNSTYTAISIEDANDNNSMVYNTSDPNGISPNSLPGPYPQGYVYYDHFPHDNILSKPDAEVTLFFQCYSSGHPTEDPTPSPVTLTPTATPSTTAPTMAPTANCTGLCIREISNDGCRESLGNLFIGCYVKQQDFGGKAKWNGVADVTGYTIFYNQFHLKWIIDGVDGYSAAIDGTQRYPPIIDDSIGPPETAQWSVFDRSYPFAPDCKIDFKYFCFGTGIPTKAPTRSPTTAEPTTGEPTIDPTISPSNAPIQNPTNAPSISPTLAPTPSPTIDCKGFNLTGTDELNGLYRREVNDTMANRYYWKQIKGDIEPIDGEIFWSDSVLHESWIINSDSKGRYWLSQTRPDRQPLLSTKWELYLGASPFTEDERLLNLECFTSLPPTRAPTNSPSFSPTNYPSLSPSNTPTTPPSSTPSLAPSFSPSDSPTTQSPTIEPTSNPTSNPTPDPTAEPCKYLLITNVGIGSFASNVNDYEGVYILESNPNDLWRRTVNGGNYILSYTNTSNYWRIINNLGTGLILEIAGSGKRPPYNAKYWQFDTDATTNYSLHIDCSESNAPSSAPSTAPSLSPTSAPTSSCRGLYFNNTHNVNFKYNGWFSREDDFTINNHKYWISINKLATIEYVRGYWHLMEKDNDLSDDEDPVMLTRNGSNLLSPPSGIWIYANKQYVVSTAMVTISCHATYAPTTDPTKSPSKAPTNYVMPSWSFCPNLRPYFTFISDENSAVYWPQPILNDHLYDINISVTPQILPGDDVSLPGMQTIEYVATDSIGTQIQCDVNIIVIGGAAYSSYEYCKRERFHIELKFNDSYYELADDQEIIDENEDEIITPINGIIYEPSLQIDEQNCYVTAEKISNYGTVEISNPPSKSSFLGLEAVNVLWEILILLLILILLCLIIDCLYRCYKDRKNAQDAKDDEQTEHLLASQQLSTEQKEEEQQQQQQEEEEEKEEKQQQHAADIELQETQEPVADD